MQPTPDPYAPDDDAPAPVADGAADGVLGRELPDIELECTDGGFRRLPDLFAPRSVVYVYPATGVPGRGPASGWDLIPGAAGCTVQSLGFRDHSPQFSALGFNVFGLSAQPSHEQREFASRVKLDFPLLSDPDLVLAQRLGLPTFIAGGSTFYRRLAMTVEAGRVTWVDYPIFPSHTSASRALAHLRTAATR